MESILLTSLAWSWHKIFGGSYFAADLEGHGRLERIFDADLSRTIGWFTTLSPFLLTVGQVTMSNRYSPSSNSLGRLKGRSLEYMVAEQRNNERNAVDQPAAAQLHYLGRFDEVGQTEDRYVMPLFDQLELKLIQQRPVPTRPI